MRSALISLRQRGFVLVVGLIMLVIVTLMVVTAFQMSTGNLKVVGNLQFRNEATAAANALIEKSLTVANFAAHSEGIDLNNDGTTDYTVSISRSCLQSVAEISSSAGYGSSVSLPFTGGANSYWVLWDYSAVVTNAATGASVDVHQGVRQKLTQAQCDAQCPPSVTLSCS